jgi:hypothetical protein
MDRKKELVVSHDHYNNTATKSEGMFRQANSFTRTIIRGLSFGESVQKQSNRKKQR